MDIANATEGMITSPCYHCICKVKFSFKLCFFFLANIVYQSVKTILEFAVSKKKKDGNITYQNENSFAKKKKNEDLFAIKCLCQFRT